VVVGGVCVTGLDSRAAVGNPSNGYSFVFFVCFVVKFFWATM
jgi:hypothetical protein